MIELNPTIKEYDEKFREYMKDHDLHTIPHCDSRILHSPENGCLYCNSPEWNGLRAIRKEMKLRYTGESTTEDWDTNNGWEPCPSEQIRDLANINAWGGNVPKYDREFNFGTDEFED